MKLQTKAVWVKCNGEAHGNPFIDNCMVCIPFWGSYPKCPNCNKCLTDKGYCKNCKNHFDLRKENS